MSTEELIEINEIFDNWFDSFLKTVPVNKRAEAGDIRISCYCGGCNALFTMALLEEWKARNYIDASSKELNCWASQWVVENSDLLDDEAIALGQDPEEF
jgi:hypothetical protein